MASIVAPQSTRPVGLWGVSGFVEPRVKRDLDRNRALRGDDSPAERPKRRGKQHLVAQLEQDLTHDAEARRGARHHLHEIWIQRFAVAALDVRDEGVDQARLTVNRRVVVKTRMLAAQLALCLGCRHRVAVRVPDV